MMPGHALSTGKDRRYETPGTSSSQVPYLPRTKVPGQTFQDLRAPLVQELWKSDLASPGMDFPAFAWARSDRVASLALVWWYDPWDCMTCDRRAREELVKQGFDE